MNKSARRLGHKRARERQNFEASYQKALDATATLGSLAQGIELKRLEALRQAGHEPRRVRRITGHTGISRFMIQDLVSNPTHPGEASRLGEIPRIVSSPYAYSPTHGVYEYKKTGRNFARAPWIPIPVFIVETAHKQYDVFEVPSTLDPRRSR